MSSSSLRIHDWSRLDPAGRIALLRRPAQRDQDETMAGARAIVNRVRNGGDRALLDLTAEHDRVHLTELKVGEDEINAAATALSPNEKRAIEIAIGTVRAFHEAQVQQPIRVETAPGVVCERITVPLEAIGMYVPAGTAPLPSTALMIGVPAQIAGCERRVLCTPPRRDGKADPGVLYTARACGVT
ncbi:MAG: histidinol dehydrogenase, partial [Gemmatimonadales bacterium]